MPFYGILLNSSLLKRVRKRKYLLESRPSDCRTAGTLGGTLGGTLDDDDDDDGTLGGTLDDDDDDDDDGWMGG